VNLEAAPQPGIRLRASASASRRHDVPSATSGVPAPTNNPSGGDGCACAGADGRSSLRPSELPALLQEQHSVRSPQEQQRQRQRWAEYPSGRCDDSLRAPCSLFCSNHFHRCSSGASLLARHAKRDNCHHACRDPILTVAQKPGSHVWRSVRASSQKCSTRHAQLSSERPAPLNSAISRPRARRLPRVDVGALGPADGEFAD
jgi:hypothetical protein